MINKIILVYHGIGSSDKLMEVSEVDFKQQINYLLKQGFTFLSLEELLRARVKAIALVFDDGLLSVMRVVSFLEQKGICFGLSLIVNEINKKTEGYLNQEQLLSFKNCEFYSHGWSHKDFTNLSSEELRSEFIISRSVLEKIIGKKVVTIVYPFGRYDKRVVNLAKKCGYEYGLGLLPFFLSTKADFMCLPRININGFLNFNKFKFFVSRAGNLYLHLSFLIKKILRRDYLIYKIDKKHV